MTIDPGRLEAISILLGGLRREVASNGQGDLDDLLSRVDDMLAEAHAIIERRGLYLQVPHDYRPPEPQEPPRPHKFQVPGDYDPPPPQPARRYGFED